MEVEFGGAGRVGAVSGLGCSDWMLHLHSVESAAAARHCRSLSEAGTHRQACAIVQRQSAGQLTKLTQSIPRGLRSVSCTFKQRKPMQLTSPMQGPCSVDEEPATLSTYMHALSALLMRDAHHFLSNELC